MPTMILWHMNIRKIVYFDLLIYSIQIKPAVLGLQQGIVWFCVNVSALLQLAMLYS